MEEGGTWVVRGQAFSRLLEEGFLLLYGMAVRFKEADLGKETVM